MNLFLYQLKLAFNLLAGHKRFSTTVITTMAFTFTALITVFTLTYVLLLKPLPYPEQEKLTYVEHRLINDKKQVDGTAFVYSNLMYMINEQQVFEQGVAMYFDGDVLTSESNKPMVEISFVTPEWFNLLDIQLHSGNGFTSEQGINTHSNVTLISHKFWTEQFNQDPNILDRTVTFAGKNFRIIGVLVEGYRDVVVQYQGLDTDLIVPWDFNSVSERDRNQWGNDDGSLMYVGKLKNGVTTQQAQQQLTSLINDNWQKKVSDREFFKDWEIDIKVKPLAEFLVADSESYLLMLLTGVVGLAIIATANLTNLFAANAVKQLHSLAISAAIGGKPRQLFIQLFAQALILMAIAAMLGLLLSALLLNLLQSGLVDYVARASELHLDIFSVLSAVLVALLFSFIFGYFVNRTIKYQQLIHHLNQSGKGSKPQVSKRARRILISCQISVAVSLIFANALFFFDAAKTLNKSLGYQTDQLYGLVLAIPNANQGVSEDAIGNLKSQLLAHPEIKAVSQSMRPSAFFTLALSAKESSMRFSIGGKDIDEHYFDVIKQPFLKGENITAQDRKDRERVLIINETFAKQLVPNGDALNFAFDNGLRVKGIVKDIIVPGETESRPLFYYPSNLSRNMLIVESATNQPLSRDLILEIIKNASAQLNIFSFEPLSYYTNNRLIAAKVSAISTLCLIVTTLILTTIGLFGVVSYFSQLQRTEIGTRLALGARTHHIWGLILNEVKLPYLVGGIVFGLITLLISAYAPAWFANNTLITLLWCGLSAYLLVALITLVACYFPVKKFLNKQVISNLREAD